MTVLTTPAPAATTWQLDPAHTRVEFAVRHLMISTVRGHFRDVSGTVLGHPSNPVAATVDLRIGAASIDTGVGQRDDHLRSADFLGAETFPELVFRSRRVEKANEGLRVIGDLTIRGTTREVVLAVQYEGGGRDPWGGDRAAYHATTTIKRSDFGLTWNMVLEAGGVAVGDEVKITIDTELVGQLPVAA